MALLTLVPPTSEPITLTQMKNYARVDFPEDDTLFLSLMAAAREWCEVYCQRRFILRTMQLWMDFFPGYVDFKMAGQKVSSPFVSGSNAVLVGIRYAIALPYPKVRSVNSFSYLDENGAEQQMTQGTGQDQYNEDLLSQPARLTPPFGQMWPVARVITNAVQVTYTTGYGGLIPITMTQGSPLLGGFVFPKEYVGLAISIPGAGATGQPLVTTILSVDTNGVGTAAANATTAVTGVQAYLGEGIPWAIQVAVMRLALYYYQNRDESPDEKFLRSVKQQLEPYRDLRL